MTDTPQVLFAHHLKTLKLPTFLREYDKLARQCAAEWTEIFGSERLTGALLDRLTHHVHILEMNGESYRLNQSRKRQKSQKRLLDH